MNDKYKNKLKKELLEILDFFDKICKKNNLKYYLGGGTLLGAIRHDGFIPWDDDIDVYMPREDYNKLLKLKINNEKYWLDNYKTNKQNWHPFSKIRLKNTEFYEQNIPLFIENQGFWIDILPIDNTKNTHFSFLKIRKRLVEICKNILLYKTVKKKNYDSICKKIFYNFTKFIPNFIILNFREFIMQLENNKKNKYLISFGSRYKVENQLHLKEKIFPLKKHVFELKKYPIPYDYDYVLTKIYGKDYMIVPPKDKQRTHYPTKIKFSDGEEMYFDEKI